LAVEGLVAGGPRAQAEPWLIFRFREVFAVEILLMLDGDAQLSIMAARLQPVACESDKSTYEQIEGEFERSSLLAGF
jgi:hypothetical protein